MFYGNELHFMCDVLKKSRVPVCFASPNDSINKVLDKNLLSILKNSKISDMLLSDFTGKVEKNTLYKNIYI